jgi:nicotinamidase-related amidase
MVLLVVDVQKAIMAEKPYDSDAFIERLKVLIAGAREKSVEVVYVRHNEPDSDLAYGADGWQIADAIAPRAGERIFEKTFNSAFHQTKLKAYLDEKGVDTLVLVGLQTEYCIDATLKSAFDLGYQIIVPEDCNSTVDNGYLTGEKIKTFFNEAIWRNRFAKLMPVADVLTFFECDPR